MLTCDILTAEIDVIGILPEWRSLQRQAAGGYLTDPDRLLIWWNSFGKHRHQCLYIITGRRKGKLVAVLPLALLKSRRLGLRVLTEPQRPAAFCDAVCENPDDIHLLLQAAKSSSDYDVAKIRGAYPGTECDHALARIGRAREDMELFSLRVDWPESQAWKASLPKKILSNLKRRIRNLEKRGLLSYEIYAGGPFPVERIARMVQMKTAALAAKGKRGLFDDPHIGSYIERLAEWEARVGTLFFNTLKCGEKEIAYLLGTIWDGSLDTVIWTYDPDYAAESPGTLIVVNSISWAIDHGLKICNFLYTGGQTEKDFKRRFSNISAKTHEYSFSNTMRGRVLEEASYATWAIKRKLDPALAVSR